MAQTVAKPRVDFLRHIVNRILAESRLPRQIVEDVRKEIGYAEERFKFSAFGGDPRRLAEYLRSRDFDNVARLLLSAKADEVLRRILEEVKRRYAEYREVVEAAEERLKEYFEKGRTGEELETKLGLVYNVLKNLEDKGVEVKLEKNEVKAQLRGPIKLDMSVRYLAEKRAYQMTFKIEGVLTGDTTARIYDAASLLVDTIKRLTQP